MADQLTLVLQVQGAQKLVELRSLVQGVGTAGVAAESQLKAAAEQTEVIKRGFAQLASQFKTSFEQLAAAVKSTRSEMSQLEEAAKPKSGKTRAKQIKEDADEATISAAKLKAALQAAYDAKLIGTDKGIGKGRSSVKGEDLRWLKEQGVQLSPEDRGILKVYKDQLSGLEEYAKRTKQIEDRLVNDARAHSEALRMNAAFDRQVALSVQRDGMMQVQARREMAKHFAEIQKREQDMGKAHSAALKMNADLEAAARMKAQQQGWEEVKARAEMEKDFAKRAEARKAMALQWMRQETELAAFNRKVLDADLRFNSAGRNQASTDLKQLNIAKGVREYIAASRPLDEIRAKFGDSALAIARNEQAFRTLEASATAALNKVQKETKEEVLDLLAVRDAALSASVAFDQLSAKQRLSRASAAQEFMRRGGSASAAVRQYGGPAVALAGNAEEMNRLKSSVEAVKPALDEHVKKVDVAREAYAAYHTSLRGAAGALGAIWLTWGKPLTALWAGFTVAVGLREAIVQFAKFENTLTTIGAIAGETGQSLQSIGDGALEMSRKAIQGPQAVIDTLRVMTQAGLSAKDSLSQLRTVLDFATVGEMKPDAAAQSLVGISSAFGFPVDQMSRVGDVIAKAAAISQTSIENMTSSVKVSSVVAEQYGARIEDVGAVLAVLAKRNIDATSAGTALRNAYTEIYTPTDKAKKALDSLGISAYDASTKQMKPFIQVMGEIRQAVLGLDKQSQNAFFQIIFGERGGKVGSALLNDLDGLKKAMKEVGDSANFVDEAAIRMQDSLQNRATIAVNNLKASLIQAGAAAEGPLRQIVDTLATAFADPRLVQALQTIAEAFASFVKLVVDNAELIGRVLTVYVGMRAAGALINVASRARDAAVALNAVPTPLAAAAEAAGSSASKLGALESGFLKLMGGIGRFLGPLGVVIGVIELASFAWDKYAESKNKALKAQPKQAEDESATTREILKREQERVDKLRSEREVRLLGGGKEDPQLNVFERRVRDAEKAKNDVLMEFDRRRVAAGQKLEGDDYLQGRTSILVEASKRYGEAYAELQDYKKLSAERRALEDANKLAGELGAALPSGTMSKKFDELTGRGGTSYPSPLGTETASILGKEKLEFEERKKAFDRSEQILEAMRRGSLINEADYNERLQTLTDERISLLREAAQDGLNQLPRLQQLRENDINARVKDPVRREENLRAMRAQFAQLGTEWQGRINEVSNDAYNRQLRSGLDQEGAKVNRGLELAKKVDEWRRKLQEQDRDVGVDQAQFRENLGLEEQLRQAKNALEPMTDLERETAERRLAIVQRAAQKRAEYEKKYPLDFEKYVKQVNELEQQALATAEVIAQKQAQARTDPLVGVRASAVRMLGEAQNVAEQTGKAFENAFGSAESAILDFVKTGKFSMRSFADTVMLEITRMGLNQMKAGALKWISGALGGVGFGPAGSGGPSWAQAVGSGTYPAMRSGGIVGAGGAMRSGDPSWWMGAPRYAKGGPVLEADAVPIIAHKGERVLTAEQNRAYESGMGGGVVVNQTINVQGGASTHDVVRAAQAAKQEAINAMMDAQRRGRRRP